MQVRFTVVLTLTLILALVSLTVLRNQTNARVESKSNQAKPQVQRKPIQPDLPGTVSGATDPAAIPDTVAYEFNPIALANSVIMFQSPDLNQPAENDRGLRSGINLTICFSETPRLLSDWSCENLVHIQRGHEV